MGNDTIEHDYNASEWTVTLGGVSIPWVSIEFTFQEFHTPAGFSIEAPLDGVAIPTALKDKAPEVVIKRKDKVFFVGQADVTSVHASEETPGGMLSITGRDLAARFILKKIDATNMPGMNKTASQLIEGWAKELGLDTSGITKTNTLVGDLVKADTVHITRNLDYYSVAFDLASYEGFVFRVRGRKVYFGPPPAIPASSTRKLAYQKDFNTFDWKKNHANGDVQIRVMGKGKKGAKVSQTAGNGGILFEKVILDRILDPATAKAIADHDLAIVEAGLITMEISEIPGDHTLDDILYAFQVSDVAKGVDGTFYATTIHHMLTQDTHLIDLHLYNKPASTNALKLVAV
jgi:hypothetical protein